ncbi:hypothetical protein CEXT_207921 [Caerostris extrusa]|uniref:Uncharacterized protein n=1 Tax=Caerostris extrusa TaxID=172846 RepID=A0AAV4TNQ7_CAEEX|nr:hypothetical protein CEXT_207921 [Caerostris extrusa]
MQMPDARAPRRCHAPGTIWRVQVYAKTICSHTNYNVKSLRAQDSSLQQRPNDKRRKRGGWNKRLVFASADHGFGPMGNRMASGARVLEYYRAQVQKVEMGLRKRCGLFV